MMNFFSSDAFLESLAETFFPGQPASIGLYRVGGDVYRLLVINGRRVITDWSFLDLLEPVAEVPAGAQVKPVDYLPRALRGLQAMADWQAAPTPGCDACPFIDWSLFPSWDDYEAAGRRGAHNPDTRRRRRVLEKEVGPLSFLAEDPRPETLSTCIRWKSAQYRATGLPDVFRNPRYVAFYEALHRRGALAISSLSAGGRLVAVHLGMRDGPRRCSWIPAYDPELSRAAPGRLLLESLLEHGYRMGDREFDFLIGDEPYKFNYATHVRLAGPVGKAPLAQQVEQVAQRYVKRALREVPWLKGRVRTLRRQLAERFL